MRNFIRGRLPLYCPLPNLVKIPALMCGIQLGSPHMAQTVHVERNWRHVGVAHDGLTKRVETVVCSKLVAVPDQQIYSKQMGRGREAHPNATSLWLYDQPCHSPATPNYYSGPDTELVGEN